MAIVKIFFRKDGAGLLEYVTQQMKPGDPKDAEKCTLDPGEAAAQMEDVRRIHNFRGTNEAIHVIQSWSPEESKQLTSEKVNEMGRKLADGYFSGHQFHVVTHTHGAHLHNHIVINIMNMETGRSIENKKKHLYELRKLNDQIARDNGLSIPNQNAIDRERRLPEKVQKMIQYNGKSYLLDIMEKSNFARRYSTSYDEYRGILQEFGIGVQIENKNITYFYPGKIHGKRGARLGKKYDKPFLEETFRKNDELFQSRPEVRRAVRGELDTLKGRPGGESVAEALRAQFTPKDYSAFTKTLARGKPEGLPLRNGVQRWHRPAVRDPARQE